ncbi:TetR/AcrR family transcriptional regulator [Mucilaginibacter gotjawali]|uniref:AcrR family transcriptional regulator n=2 Tax=Mucilaginibacter gotjawali TaxID=1550579 RepID=A0A839SG06_9SPHI|nr:TetR/AcrR family transcriptional regulator [Mucilaginibacter gotjawali]MBB3055539.1 AcrR family transcriptional regulator [Mucilaginibacter gotjawali]BAU53181.1 putative HTH-type transcriptional regulator YvdT [Mucilaginibacter gotjawali]
MPKITQDTRANILLTTLQLFLEKGYKNVSYQDLVKHTGLSKGAIYHYFESKDALLIAVFEFLLEATKEPENEKPHEIVKDQESFMKLFIAGKTKQIDSFKKLMGNKPLKLNRLLFFFEAISENQQLKQILVELSKHELTILEGYFAGLNMHHAIPKGKDIHLLAESLYWMLQGGEMSVFFLQEDDWEDAIIKMYQKTITDFFKII